MTYSNNNLPHQILRLNTQWENTDKGVIATNLERYIEEKYPDECQSCDDRMRKLMFITNSKKQTVYSWLNRSRTNVKIPFLKLCVIADYLKMDIESFLQNNVEIADEYSQ